MVGRLRLDNVHACVERALAEGVPGDLMETGVWRGGVTIFMRAILAAYGVTDRTVWVADSFAGLPPPRPDRYPADRGFDLSNVRYLAVSRAQVEENFARYGLLDTQVQFLEGWFRDTLPEAPSERLAVLRLDGDLYESTHDALVHLYDGLSPLAASCSSTTSRSDRLAARRWRTFAASGGSRIRSRRSIGPGATGASAADGAPTRHPAGGQGRSAGACVGPASSIR